MKKQIAIPVLALALGVGGYFLYRRFAPPPRHYTLYGNVDIREVTLAFRVSGRVEDVMADEGDAVKEGDALALLDAEPLQNALDAAEAALRSISARNSLIHSGSRAEDIAQAKARTEAASAALVNAQQQYDRLVALVASGIVSQDSVDTAKAVRDQAEANLRALEEQYKALDIGFRAEEKAESDALLKQAQANLDASRLAIRDAVLRAPSDGYILTRAIEKGAMVQAGAPAFSLSLTSPVWVRAYVEEPQLGYFNTGTKVLLFTDSRPERPYAGTVGFVSPTAEFTPKSVETPDLRTALVYRIRVVVNDPDPMLRQGMPVTIRRAENQ
ncbi:MAG: secretion protein HlyD [Holophagales bacterium]|jgi:HlyD family secretion protein|nr:secretion protein HlyD [Holophagales bacterium]